MEEKKGLCFRCEHRARYLETGSGPRCECKSEKTAVCGCYMYTPVKPVVLAVNEGDTRPQFAGSMISARSHYVGIADGKLALKKYKDGSAMYWDLKK